MRTVCALALTAFRLFAESNFTAHPVPEEFVSHRYEVNANGKPIPVFHAELNLHFVSFDFTGTIDIEVRSTDANYWRGGAIVRPLSRGIQPVTEDKRVSFRIASPGQFSVEAPLTSAFRDEALFVFANAPDSTPVPSNAVVIPPGVHMRNIKLTTGQTLYLSPGAVVFGGIDIWDAHNVRIAGRGVVLYYGPQSLDIDTGWKHQPNWHPLTAHQVTGLNISGVTFIGRSRTWSLQLFETKDVEIENIKVIAASETNINQDGIDWLGGGNAHVRNSFFRTADDSFAFLNSSSLPVFHTGQSEGRVENITIEKCVLWTTLANVFRLGWRGQSIKTQNIVFRDSDVIHMSRGYWQGPWALLHAASVDIPGKAEHRDYLLENIRFEEPAALLGINYDSARFTNITFRNITLPGPAVPSLLRNSAIDGITFDNVSIAGKSIRSEAEFDIRRDNGTIQNFLFPTPPNH